MSYYETAWSMYFASITSFQYHPANHGNEKSLEECAKIADQMIEIQHKRFTPWHGEQ